ncbi:glycosyltransferase family 4 protein [bacterium]|nr:glycosyltransferase family 4 protein [bacterium]
MRKKIKIAHIITKMELGGAQQNTLYTLKHLNREKFETILICGKGGMLAQETFLSLTNRVFFIGELIRKINPFFDFMALIKIWYLLKKEKIDLVHTHSSKAGILGRWAAKLAGVPYIVHTFHGFGFNDYQKWPVRWLFIGIERITAFITTKLIVVSGENTKKAMANKIGEKNQYLVIHSGIKVKELSFNPIIKKEKRKEFGFNDEDFVVGMIACFKPQKDPLSFILLAHKVSACLPQVKFLLVGDGLLRPSIEKLIYKLNLQEKIQLPGWRRDIPQLIQSFDIMVLTSLWEGLPRVFPEAMVLGIPVVATEVDGAGEVIKDGINGFLVPPKDMEAMAKKVIYLFKNGAKRRQMGMQAKAMLPSAFDIDEMVKEIEMLYDNVVIKNKKQKGKGLRWERQ